MNRLLDRETLTQLLKHRGPPLPVPADSSQLSGTPAGPDPLQATGQATGRIPQQGHAEQARSLLEPFHALIDNNDFWNHNLDGLAAFAAKDYFQVYRLQRSVPEMAVANARMHLAAGSHRPVS